MISHISKIESLKLAGECTNAIEAGNFLRTSKADLLFLDIQMPEINGLQFIGTLKNPPAIILTTAYRDFAPEAFDVDAIDYLLKPISFERFLQAVHRFFERQKNGISTAVPTDEPFLQFRSERKVIVMPVADIRYIESLDAYVKVHAQEKLWITRETISSLEENLGVRGFVRIHRSFLINPRHITAFSAESVFLDKVELPLGRAFKRAALALLQQTSS